MLSMRTVKKDPTFTESQNRGLIIEHRDRVLHQFEVLAIDNLVDPYMAAYLMITETLLIISRREDFLVYQLDDIQIEAVGNEPGTSLWQLMIESSSQINPAQNWLQGLQDSDAVMKLRITGKDGIPSDYVLKEATNLLFNIQSWANIMHLVYIQSRQNIPGTLLEIEQGFFSRFNRRTVLAFIAVFIVYFILFYLQFSNDLGIISDIINWIFGVVLVLMGIWTALSFNKNLKRYSTFYKSFQDSEYR